MSNLFDDFDLDIQKVLSGINPQCDCINSLACNWPTNCAAGCGTWYCTEERSFCVCPSDNCSRDCPPQTNAGCQSRPYSCDPMGCFFR